MTIEETIAALIEAKIAPLTDAIRQLTAEVDRLRRALPTQLVTVPVAAEALGLSVATVRRRVKDGTVPVRRVGKSVRIDLAAALHGPTNNDVRRHAARVRMPKERP